MLFQVLGYGDTYMPLLTLLIFLRFRKKIRKEEGSFIYFITVNLLLFGATNVLYFFSINNLLLYHFYYLFELVFIAGYILKQRLYSAVLFYSITIFYTFFWVLTFFIWDQLQLFSSYAAVLERAVVILICIYYIAVNVKKGVLFKPGNIPAGWIVCGFLLSSVCGLLSVPAYHYFLQNLSINPAVNAWMFESIGTILKFTFIITGFICYKFQRLYPYR